ncbi:MAG: hypothetical protein MJ065_08720 [Oscillospiraceae bacterium]|nr:hypothetical protein [Oscillospiraceae bacterium]
MRITLQMEKQFEQNRLHMNKINSGLRKYLGFSVTLGALFFGTAFMAGAMSVRDGNAGGPGIFYLAMSAGIFQILLGILTIVLSGLVYMKKRTPCVAMLLLFVIALALILLRPEQGFRAGNVLLIIPGIALNIYALLLISEDKDLQEQTGYPHFDPKAAFSAEYEESADVLARRAAASPHMDLIGTPAQPIPPTHPENVTTVSKVSFAPTYAPQERNEDGSPKALGPTPSIRLPQSVSVSGPLDLSEMTKPFSTQQAPVLPPEPVSVPDIPLKSLADAADAVQTPALPQLDPAVMLTDMTAIPSHATTQGNPDMLPTPEEVRARLAAMRRAREEHHPES